MQELFGNVTLKQVTKPLRWSNMATMPILPETQESIKEEIRRQVCAPALWHLSPPSGLRAALALTLRETGVLMAHESLVLEYFLCLCSFRAQSSWHTKARTSHGADSCSLSQDIMVHSTGLEVKRPGLKFLLCS